MSLGYVQMPLFVARLPPGSAFGDEGQQLSEEDPSSWEPFLSGSHGGEDLSGMDHIDGWSAG